MEPWESIRIVLRRWYVVATALLLTLLAVFAARSQVDPRYEASASMVVTPASKDLVIVEGKPQFVFSNPYTRLGGSLPTMTQILTLTLSSDEIRTSMAKQQLSTDYDVSIVSRSPIFRMAVRADTPELALASRDKLVELAAEQLQARQNEVNAPENNFLNVQLLSRSSRASEQAGSQTRVMLAVGVAGIAAAIAAAFVFEALASSGRRRRGELPPVGLQGPARWAAADDTPTAVQHASPATVHAPAETEEVRTAGVHAPTASVDVEAAHAEPAIADLLLGDDDDDSAESVPPDTADAEHEEARLWMPGAVPATTNGAEPADAEPDESEPRSLTERLRGESWFSRRQA